MFPIPDAAFKSHQVLGRTKHLSVAIRSEFIHWALWRTLVRTEYFLFVHYTTSILAKLSTWCFEQSGDISCSLLVNPSHTDESWEGRNKCLWLTYIYVYIYIYIYIYIIFHTWYKCYLWLRIKQVCSMKRM